MTFLDELSIRTRNYIALERKKEYKNKEDYKYIIKYVFKALQDMGVHYHVISMRENDSLVFYSLDVRSITNRLTPLFFLPLNDFDINYFTFIKI